MDRPFQHSLSGFSFQAQQLQAMLIRCPMGPFEALLGHLSEAGHGRVRGRTSIRLVVELSCRVPARRLKWSRALDLDVHHARADPAPFGKTASRDPSTRSPRRCWHMFGLEREQQCLGVTRSVGATVRAETHTQHDHTCPPPAAAAQRCRARRRLFSCIVLSADDFVANAMCIELTIVTENTV